MNKEPTKNPVPFWTIILIISILLNGALILVIADQKEYLSQANDDRFNLTAKLNNKISESNANSVKVNTLTHAIDSLIANPECYGEFCTGNAVYHELTKEEYILVSINGETASLISRSGELTFFEKSYLRHKV